MIIGFSKHGRGGGDRAVNYLTEGMESAVAYLTGKARLGQKRTPAPVCLRGDPRITRRLINEVPFKRRYVSGVLSFSEEKISPKMEAEIMDRVESVAFAGLPRDRYNILWIRHAHTGRHEMHFLTPAIDLGSGKCLNINPPRETTREFFDALRSLINDDCQLSHPDDPARRRAIRMPSCPPKSPQTRADLQSRVGQLLQPKLEAGVIRNRDDVVRLLRAAGYEITRVGEGYVTIADPATGKRCRLKGRLFEKDFSAALQKPEPYRLLPEERTRLETRLSDLVEARTKYNHKRYGVSLDQPNIEPLPPAEPIPVISHYDRTRESSALRSAGFDDQINRTWDRVGTALERGDCAVRRWRVAVAGIDHAARYSLQAGERFERTAREFETRTFPRLKTRAATKIILKKYTLTLNSGRGVRGLEPELEMEMDR